MVLKTCIFGIPFYCEVKSHTWLWGEIRDFKDVGDAMQLWKTQQYFGNWRQGSDLANRLVKNLVHSCKNWKNFRSSFSGVLLNENGKSSKHCYKCSTNWCADSARLTKSCTNYSLSWGINCSKWFCTSSKTNSPEWRQNAEGSGRCRREQKQMLKVIYFHSVLEATSESPRQV